MVDALRRRAQSVLNDTSVDAQSRAIIRYALEMNDPWLAELVRQADAGGTIDLSVVRLRSEEDVIDKKINILTKKICRGDEESTAALLVLMATLENATHPKALAKIAKHLVFTRCGELNVYGMVDAQIAALEGELFGNTVQ